MKAMIKKYLIVSFLFVGLIFLIGCTQPKQREYVCWNEQVVLNPEHCPQKEVDTGSSIAGGFCQGDISRDTWQIKSGQSQKCTFDCVNGQWKEARCDLIVEPIVEDGGCPSGGWWYDWTTNRCLQTDR